MTDDTIILKLEGSRSDHGLPLASFETFVQSFRRALTDYDRQRRGDQTRRSGALTTREELVTAFRIVSLKPGSTVVELQAIAPDEDPDQEQLAPGEPVSLQTLRSLLETVESDREEIDPAVIDSLSEARKALGSNGSIVVQMKNGGWRKRHAVVIDSDRIEKLEKRSKRATPRPLRVTGRLHRIELEPDKVGIRTPGGVDFTAKYDAETEATIKDLLDSIVVAEGMGYQTSAQRGTLTIGRIRKLPTFEQTPLFTEEPIPLDDLLDSEPRLGGISVLPEDVPDDELEAFLDAVEAL